MNETAWADVDRYITDALVPQDEVLTQALRMSEAAGLPSIAVSASQGKLLHILARAMGARSALEIGTLGGYSTIWIARALLGGGLMITLEADPKHAEDEGLADVLSTQRADLNRFSGEIGAGCVQLLPDQGVIAGGDEERELVI